MESTQKQLVLATLNIYSNAIDMQIKTAELVNNIFKIENVVLHKSDLRLFNPISLKISY
jgi:hypothetical protein